MKDLLTAALLFGPAAVIVVYLIRSQALSMLKGVALAAMFLGATTAYVQSRGLGVCGLILAIAGLVCYLEEIRKDVFREMKRISDEENERD